MDNSSTGAPSRTQLVLLLIFILGCLFSTVRILRDVPKPWRTGQDDIGQRSDERFAAVKHFLPNQGVVGYVGEPGDSSLPDYYLAQYALAPLVVDRSIQHKLVLGNFPSRQVPASLPGLRQIQDFGNGVVLLTNEDSR